MIHETGARAAVPTWGAVETAPTSAMADIVLSHLTERSILHGADVSRFEAYVVAGRKRLATCSGVAWFRGYHLAVVNLYGGHLRVYRFHPAGGRDGRGPRLELLHERTDGLTCPEDVAVSPDGHLLAVTHSLSDDLGVTLHPIDAASLAPAQGEMVRRGRHGSAFHGVTFSPDSAHLAFTEVGPEGYVEVVKIGAKTTARTCLLENRHAPMKPKSVAFSRDGRFALIAMTQGITTVAADTICGGLLSVHSFAASSGVIAPDPVVELRGIDMSIGTVEICTFLPTAAGTPYRILAANPGTDVVSAFDFDPDDRTLVFAGIFARSLSFPHGIDASADGAFVAVTTYGDDRLHILRARPRSTL